MNKIFLIIFMGLILLLPMIYAQEIQEQPRCSPFEHTILFGWCKFWSFDFPKGLAQIQTYFDGNHTRLIELDKSAIIERQREHFTVLLAMKQGIITPQIFAEKNNQIMDEYNKKLSEFETNYGNSTANRKIIDDVLETAEDYTEKAEQTLNEIKENATKKQDIERFPINLPVRPK